MYKIVIVLLNRSYLLRTHANYLRTDSWMLTIHIHRHTHCGIEAIVQVSDGFYIIVCMEKSNWYYKFIKTAESTEQVPFSSSLDSLDAEDDCV